MRFRAVVEGEHLAGNLAQRKIRDAASVRLEFRSNADWRQSVSRQ